MKPLFYRLFSSPFGTFSIVWYETEKGPKVRRVFLPREGSKVKILVRTVFAEAKPLSCSMIQEVGKEIQRFLEGEAVRFKLHSVDLEKCSLFQRRVLLAEYAIPRGWISTYGRIAESLRIPGGARAVGSALAHNPFPIIIPCHRAIKSDGELGGFQGGLKMKRALLRLEGVELTGTGKVLMRKIYYG